MKKEELIQIQEMESRLKDSLQENTIDCVILGYEDRQLKVLLLKWKFEEIWSLPGGYIHQSEDFDQAARRILLERTGLKNIFLKQFYTFGSPHRNVGSEQEIETLKGILQRIPLVGKTWDIDWFTKRFVTTGYFALVNISKTTPNPDFLSERCEWVAFQDVPKLLSDHNKILEKALHQLRIELHYLPVGISLLPEKFTMKDLQRLYEAILNKKLVRSNFQRKMLKLDILNRHEKQMSGAANKAPYLYSFHPEKYDALIKKGLGYFF